MQLNNKASEYAKQKTVILAITTDPLILSKQVEQQNGVTVPILYDPNHETGDKYGVYNVPGGMDMGPVDTHSIFIIDKEGVMRWHQISAQKMHIPQSTIDKELKKIWG